MTSKETPEPVLVDEWALAKLVEQEQIEREVQISRQNAIDCHNARIEQDNSELGMIKRDTRDSEALMRMNSVDSAAEQVRRGGTSRAPVVQEWLDEQQWGSRDAQNWTLGETAREMGLFKEFKAKLDAKIIEDAGLPPAA